MSADDTLTINFQESNEELAGRNDGGAIEQESVLAANILVAEDNPVNQEVAKMMLELLGYRVDLAENGIKAVEMAANVRYDLILMDCQMPEMDGFEAVRVIREREQGIIDPASRRVPVIAMTGNSTDEDRDICLKMGMDDFLRKPFTYEVIQEVIGRWISISDKVWGPLQDELALRGEDAVLDQGYLDNILVLQKEGAPDILCRVIDQYLSESPAAIRCLKDAVEANEIDVIRSIAHRFKSGSANLGASGFAELCREMESKAGTNTMIGNREILTKIDSEYAAVETALTAVRQGRGK